MFALTFLEAPLLLLLLLVAALVAVYVFMQTRRKAYAVRFTNIDLLDSVAPQRPGWRRHAPAILFILALTSLVLAVARPATDIKVPRERATIILAIDTSLSMEADDVAPNRIRAAQAAAKSFLDLLPPKINVGLVTFNGTAQIRVTPTTDRAAVKSAIDGIELGERTAIGEAIFASLDALKSAPPGPKGQAVPARIVLMSDGETTTGRPDAEGAAAAKKAKVPVSTIAFGTDHGTITVPDQAEPVDVSVNRDALAQIAKDTGGSSFSAASEGQLKKVYADIGSSVGYTKELKEIGIYSVGLGIALLFVTAALSLIWFSRLP